MHGVHASIADFVVGTTADQLGPEVDAAARRALVDAFASILSGTASDLAAPVLRYASSYATPGRHPVLGTPLRISSDRAALVNGTLGHAMDFDDTVSFMPGHPGVVITSALLAAIPNNGVSGRDFLTAFVVGYEVATKMGGAIGMSHYDRGWHSTGTIGVFGAFAACSSMLKLDRAGIMNGLGIAASTASGLRINFGTMSKPLHSGWAAASGLTAVQLASCGVTGHPRAVDGDDGFFAVYGSHDSDTTLLVDSLGSPFTLVEPGVTLKKYPCCFALHRAIDAMEQIRTETEISPTTVRSVVAKVPPGSLKPLPYDRPTNGLEARFSMPYVLAVGILDGRYGMDDFTDDAATRPAIKDLLDRVHAREDPSCMAAGPDGRASAGTRGNVTVQVEMKDGTTIERQVEVAPGTPTRPLSNDELTAKFNSCARLAGLAEAQVSTALDVVRRIDEHPQLGVLIEALSKSSKLEARETSAGSESHGRSTTITT